MWYKLCKIRY